MANWFNTNPIKGAFIILAGAVLILFGKALFDPDLLFSIPQGDLAGQFLAWREFGFSELKSGHLVFWNPYIYCGAPYFSGFQSALLYPPNWLFMVMPLIMGLNFSAALHIFLGGFFCFLWLSQTRTSFLPSLFGAFAFMFGGAFFLHVYPGHLPNLCTMAWIPLVFLFLDRYFDSLKLKWLLSGMGALGLELLSGHVQYFYYTLLFSGFYYFVRLLMDRRQWVVKSIGGLALVLGSFLLTAVQGIPGVQAAIENPRPTPDSSAAHRLYSFPVENLLTFFTSGLNGNISHFNCWSFVDIWWESCLFMGLTVFLFAFYGIFAKPISGKWALIALAAFALLVTLGYNTPFYTIFSSVIPFIKLFKGSYKAGVFIQLAFGVLAARALDVWIKDNHPPAWPGWLAFVMSLVFLFSIPRIDSLTFGQILEVFNSPLDTQPGNFGLQRMAVQEINLLGASSLAILFAGLWIFTQKRPSYRPALAFLGIANLFFFALSVLPFFDSKVLVSDGTLLAKNVSPMAGENRIYWYNQADRALFSRLKNVIGDDPSLPQRYARLINIQDNRFDYSRFVVDFSEPKPKLIRMAISIDQVETGYKINRVPGPRLARAALYDDWELAPSPEAALIRALAPDFDMFHKVVLESAPHPLPVKGKDSGQVVVTDVNSDILEIKAVTDRPQILLVTENYANGWQVKPFPDSVQQNYEILPGDSIHRAIPLLAGTHHFYLQYKAPGFETGLWISVVSLLAYGLTWVWVLRRRERIEAV